MLGLLSTETSTVPGGRFDPLYNVLRKKKDNRGIEKGRGSRKGRMGCGGITQTKTKQKKGGRNYTDEE